MICNASGEQVGIEEAADLMERCVSIKTVEAAGVRVTFLKKGEGEVILIQGASGQFLLLH